MRFCILISAFCLLTSPVAKAQWLETTIPLPDSSGPRALCYNAQDNKVYSANYDGDNVSVVNGATNLVVATVTALSTPTAFCYNPAGNKVHCANWWGNSVTVIDGSGDTVRTTVAVGAYPGALCYNPHDDKVYSANWAVPA